MVSTTQVNEILQRPAIAILPTLAIDPNPACAAAAAGITRDLLTLFSRWCWFPVIASGPMSNVVAQTLTTQQVGQVLGARFLVNTALRNRGDVWRLDVQVADASNGHCLCADVYDFPNCDLFDVEDRVIAEVVGQTYPHVIAATAPYSQGAHAELATWQLAHAAFDLQDRRERLANEQARLAFERVLEREPNLVLAHYGLGLIAYDQVLNQWAPQATAIELLRRSAEKCIGLARKMAEGHYLAGRLAMAQYEHGVAADKLAFAVLLNPSFAAAHSLLGQLHLMAGRLDEGLHRMQIAQRLGPKAFTAGLAVAHFARHEWQQALVAAEQAVAMSPDYPFGRALAAAAAHCMSLPERAHEHATALYRLQPTFDPTRFRTTFGTQVDAVARLVDALEQIGR